LECAPLKVSDSIPYGANFGGQVHTELCSGLERGPASGRWDWSPWISRSLERGPRKWVVESVPWISWSLDQIPSL